VLTSNKMPTGMESNMLKDFGLLLRLLSCFSFFDTLESLARFLAGGRAFLFWVPSFRVAKKSYEHNISDSRQKR
jgi:hypothetical protein